MSETVVSRSGHAGSHKDLNEQLDDLYKDLDDLQGLLSEEQLNDLYKDLDDLHKIIKRDIKIIDSALRRVQAIKANANR